MDILALEKIGLTKSEIKVYLALLKLGQTTTGPIVDEAKVTRSKIYDILERLKNKGLVSHIIKESTRYFSAANPNNILDYLKKKEDEIEKEKKVIQQILPELLLQQRSSGEKKIAEVFVGVKGMENAFNVLLDRLNPKEKWYAFGAAKGGKKIIFFFSKLHEKRTKKKVKSLIIYNESSRGLFPTQEKSKLVNVRYISQFSQSIPASINIYKDYTIISVLTEEPISLLIRKREVADSFKEYFKVMWDVAKE